MSEVVIYHNPMCSKSQRALELIRQAGIEPEVVPYLDVGWTAEQLRELATRAGLTVRALLRAGEPLAAEFGLLDEGLDDDRLLAAMVDHPGLVERAIVATPKGVVLARPPERVSEVL